MRDRILGGALRVGTTGLRTKEFLRGGCADSFQPSNNFRRSAERSRRISSTISSWRFLSEASLVSPPERVHCSARARVTYLAFVVPRPKERPLSPICIRATEKRKGTRSRINGDPSLDSHRPAGRKERKKQPLEIRLHRRRYALTRKQPLFTCALSAHRLPDSHVGCPSSYALSLRGSRQGSQKHDRRAAGRAFALPPDIPTQMRFFRPPHHRLQCTERALAEE
ncbi:hypothetical protein HPB50_024439 [Hyalomma asiaticum]|uniref:Uncharacterized protein n=1 Tax=Hyalomma asiaticum TaxID=266040 RepID=A0ACB7SSB2_HYAAI|nr:hypothetical protein HPB50_024439 [Hyalomma asiaticum]